MNNIKNALVRYPYHMKLNKMKKLIIALSLVSIMASCKKETIGPFRNQTYTVSFAGHNQPTYKCFINSNEKNIDVQYEAKSGDTLSIKDIGTDNNGEGFTSGSIIVSSYTSPMTLHAGTVVATYTGNGDTNLKYVLK